MNDSRTIVVTGVSRGLGRAMTEGFIERGHTVAGCCRSASAVKQLRKAFPAPHRFDAVDVADDAQVKAWAAAVLDELGPPDLLVNNAAIINANAPLWKVPADDFSRVVDVNVKGTFHLLRHFVPTMVRRRRGVIVNFSSGWGRSTSPEVATYCATKWAIEGLTRALAEELPAGMAAVPLNPGVINTEMLQSCFGADASGYPSPQDWAKRAVPLLLKLRDKDNGRALTVPP
jgi:NAD(P)-dependent dehydrogenase (short-subunit alcohol dehydrogenase family)